MGYRGAGHLDPVKGSLYSALKKEPLFWKPVVPLLTPPRSQGSKRLNFQIATKS